MGRRLTSCRKYSDRLASYDVDIGSTWREEVEVRVAAEEEERQH
jgi:hypothetical protein